MNNESGFENKVIVFGTNHHNTLGVIRSIGEVNIRPYVIIHGSEKGFVSRSKYIYQCWFVKDEREGLELLIQLFSAEVLKPIIICCSDGAANILDSNYNVWKDKFLCGNTGKEGGITLLMNKNYLGGIAQQCGFHLPKTWIVKNNTIVSKDITFPCIIKPLLSIAGSKADICVCNNYVDLQHYLSDRERYNRDWLVQEYIQKDYEISIVGCVLKNELVLPGVIKKLREYPVKQGSSSFAEVLPLNKIDIDLKPIKRIFEKIGYVGLFSIEFVNLQHKNYFLEINFRNDGNGYILSAAGVNLPYLYCLDQLNIETAHIQKEIEKIIYFMADLRDFRHVLEKRLTLKKWRKDMKIVDCFLVYNKQDRRPFFYELNRMLGSIIRKKLGMKR